jgi:hypothetical protein
MGILIIIRIYRHKTHPVEFFVLYPKEDRNNTVSSLKTLVRMYFKFAMIP